MFGASIPEDLPASRYNIAPSTAILALCTDSASLRGSIESSSPAAQRIAALATTINAHAKTVAKPPFTEVVV